MKVFVTNPHGYCMGVIQAIKIALQVKKANPDRRVAVLGMLVHNEEVIKMLEGYQIETLIPEVDSYTKAIEAIDPNTIVIFTAHGHDEKLDEIAVRRGIEIHDATCKMVKENSQQIKEALQAGHQVIYIGKSHHPETVAALSLGADVYLYDHEMNFDFCLIEDKSPLVINQTTLSMLEIKHVHDHILAAIPNAHIADEICDATRQRQTAVYNIPVDVELIYIVGSPKSSNTAKLTSIASSTHPNAKVRQIKTVKDILDRDLEGISYVAVASGASTPMEITDEVIAYLKQY